MHYIICLAGLPQEVVEEIQRRPAARFTEARTRPPIARRLPTPYCYRPGMSDYYLNAIATEIEELRPKEDVGIGLAYVDYGGYTETFIGAFHPFAVTIRLDPFYPATFEKHRRRQALMAYVDALIRAVDGLRERIAVVRDVLSGQRFSPLTLPLRNFRSGVLQETIGDLFQTLGLENDPRARLIAAVEIITARHPLERLADRSHRPYYEDDRGLRFKSPGRDKHAMAWKVGDGHSHSCLINGRARLGGPIQANFHYDCEYERGNVDAQYPNCHHVATAPSKRHYVNIAPNDYVR